MICAPRVFSPMQARNGGTWCRPPCATANGRRKSCRSRRRVRYVGLHSRDSNGDIRANGASASNHWFHETWDIDAGVWHDPDGGAVCIGTSSSPSRR